MPIFHESRRDFLKLAGVAAAGSAAAAWGSQAKRPKVAVIFTEFRLRSHAFNIISNLGNP